MPVPLLILSDSPSCTSGLGRITRDLATRIHEHLADTFTVATLGYGGSGSRKLPFMQYHIHDVQNWMAPELPEVWKDFAGDQKGIVMTIWDASRLRWFSRPEKWCPIPRLRQWLMDAPFERWGYFPIDAYGPEGMLVNSMKDAISGYDRILAYTGWAAEVLEKTLLAEAEIDNLPHGLDPKAWIQHDKLMAKRALRQMGFSTLEDTDFLVGVVATNQSRKDYGLAFETCRFLADRGVPVKMWVHTDEAMRHWNLLSMPGDFGMLEKVYLTNADFEDWEMNLLYSACDVTLGIGLGEGFGYPLFESLACGTPVIHGDYAGGAEFLPPWSLVKPFAWRYDGAFSCQRPVFLSSDWVKKAMNCKRWEPSVLPPELDWGVLWPRWAEWLTKGIKP